MKIRHKIQFGGDTDELAEKVMSGEKIATSSLYDYYRLGIKERMEVGEYASVIDMHGKEKCIVGIVKTEIIRFRDITEIFARNEGDGTLDNWLEIHTGYYSSLLEKIGKKLTGETELLCEWFEVVTPQNS